MVIQDRKDTVLGAYNIDTLNPITTKSKSSQRIMNIIYESLFTVDQDMNLMPLLAGSYTLSPDGYSITVYLKDGVKWQNGMDFTANDVMYTLDLISSNDGIYKRIADKIKTYTAMDNKTLTIEFSEQAPDFAYLLTFPILSPSSNFSSDESFMPMGTGSYMMSSRTSTELYLEPYTGWHGGHPAEKKITVKFLKDELTATNALNVKEIDAVALESYNQDTNIPKLNAASKTVTSNNMVFLGFNTASSVMTQNIRRVVSAIVDKQKLLDNNAYGKGKVADLSINPSSWASKFNGIEEVDADELMESDGYRLVNGIYTKDLEPFTVRILVNMDNSLRYTLAEGISDMLKGFGIETMIDAVSYDEYLNKIKNNDYDMFIGETEVMPNLDPGAMLEKQDNYFNYDISYLNEAKSALFGVSEREDIKASLDTYKTKFYNNPPYLPLYFKSDIIIYGAYVSGIDEPNLFDTFKNIENWFFYDKDGSEQNSENNK